MITLCKNVVSSIKIVDPHTHLFQPEMIDRQGKPLLLYRLDDLFDYHYNWPETLARAEITPEKFSALSTPERAKMIFKTLYQDNTPLSQATRGVLFTLKALGLPDIFKSGYDAVASAVDTLGPRGVVDKALGSRFSVGMTNDLLDPDEWHNWERGFERDDRFFAAHRIDRLLNWEQSMPVLQERGYNVSKDIRDEKTKSEIRRFLKDGNKRLNARYMAVSLPGSYTFEGNTGSEIMKLAYDVGTETGLPVALMLGVERQVNPKLKLAGDGVRPVDTSTIEKICLAYPELQLIIVLLPFQDQHSATVVARKFPNQITSMHTWWFNNIPWCQQAISEFRVDLGVRALPYCSDCRHIMHLPMKWGGEWEGVTGGSGFFDVFLPIVSKRYAEIKHLGYPLTEENLKKDFTGWFGGGNMPG